MSHRIPPIQVLSAVQPWNHTYKGSMTMSPSEDTIDAAIDAGYRSLAAAIVLQAVRDTTNPHLSQEANHFLTSPLCKSLMRLSGIQWTATSADFPRAALRLQSRRTRRQAASARSSRNGARPKVLDRRTATPALRAGASVSGEMPA